MVNGCRAARSGKGEGVGAQETGCSWAWSCGAVVAQARAATRQLFAARRQLVDLCSNFSHCATCCAIWSPRAAAAAVVADDVAVAAAAAAAAPSTMMVAPIAFCKVLAARHKSPLHSPPLPSACPHGLLPRILSIFHMSLYGRIYRSMRLIATRFCLVAEDKCNSHSNWTCTFMAFSFSFPLPHAPLPQHTPRTRSHFLLCHSHVCSTQSHKKMPKKSVLLMSLPVCVCVCECVLVSSHFQAQRQQKSFPSTQAEA